jgi:integrase
MVTGKRGSARQSARAAGIEHGHYHPSRHWIDPDNLTKAYKALLKGTRLPDQRFHDLRHTAATLMLRDGLPVHEVSAVLGHFKPSTTLNVHLHVLPGANYRATTALERLLG